MLQEKDTAVAVSKFFHTLVEMIAVVYEPYDFPMVLSGGVFQNRVLLSLVLKGFLMLSSQMLFLRMMEGLRWDKWLLHYCLVKNNVSFNEYLLRLDYAFNHKIIFSLYFFISFWLTLLLW